MDDIFKFPKEGYSYVIDNSKLSFLLNNKTNQDVNTLYFWITLLVLIVIVVYVFIFKKVSEEHKP